MKQVEPKQTLSITIPITLYQRLQQEVGKGKISKFIKETVEEKLEQEKEDLAKAYQECYANNPHLLELAKKWEKAQDEDWINWEKKRRNSK
ncbi:hypothetical protein [endosymbiont GvMRE of Glomus versiforme]|uniref:hypothetical protein n=1 Tax=endosymbiont GvMRE of Glomus versiforme TaxID=2039283 RepID=UPI000EF08E90|nr:hypothetical protein [endosymbiont GvMRE of Glomus versiforme]RHZ36900.1 hypothetical protein GvMRE_I2g243 [endosymbiont GvMRE of Glomus versiforme]